MSTYWQCLPVHPKVSKVYFTAGQNEGWKDFPQALGDNLGYVVSLHKHVWFDPLEFTLGCLFSRLNFSHSSYSLSIISMRLGLSLLSPMVTRASLLRLATILDGWGFNLLKSMVSTCLISSPSSLHFQTNLISVYLDRPSMIPSGFWCYNLKINTIFFKWIWVNSFFFIFTHEKWMPPDLS